MLACETAIQKLLEVADRIAKEQIGVERIDLAKAIERTLAEPVVSDIDSPPFDKALMDGFAICGANLPDGFPVAEAAGAFSIIGEIAAGDVADFEVGKGEAARIMTGAPLPVGADSVIMLERAEATGTAVSFADPGFKVGQNVMRRAESLAEGQTVLQAPRRIRAMEVGLLAEVGKAQVRVVRKPKVSCLATGSELVEASSKPIGGQIRNSNGPLLASWCRQLGCDAESLGIGEDDASILAAKVQEGLKSDVLLLSGGVSAGDYDLVPQTLANCGVQKLFHKVSIKPGKPLWAGVFESKKHRCLVIGLPGNPVSSLVCFQVFARPVLNRLAAAPWRAAFQSKVVTDRAHRQRGDRPTYWPARFGESNQTHVELLPWLGSADLRTLVDADLLVIFPSGQTEFPAGAELDAIEF